MRRISTHHRQIHTFQVEGTEKACGETYVLVNGQKLDSEWDGTTGRGRDYLDIYEGKEAEWHISCLYNVIPEDGSNSNGEDVVHVLSLRVVDSKHHPGFTISYKQMGSPSILRFEPRYNPTDMAIVPSLATLWRTPSLDSDPNVLANGQAHSSTAIIESLHRGQAILQAKLKAWKSQLKLGIEKVNKLCCHKASEIKTTMHQRPTLPEEPALPSILTLPETPAKVPLDRLLEPPPALHDELTPTTEELGSTNTVPIHAAATTRSLSHVVALDPTTTHTSSPSLPSQSEHNLQLLKIFSLVLILSSCLAWLFLQCRDPRKRAECLARQEERRNKKLYRRAARQYKVRMFFWNRYQEVMTGIWNFRMRYRLAHEEAITWDEKRARVLEQEGVLEEVMRDDIRALRNAHRMVSDITIAEEGRANMVYEVEGSARGRSVSTLPGYESEGSQPPSYSDAGDGLEGAMVVNGFRYTAAETEFRSDSSVISTSPRLSRDGANSDFDEKIEPLSLEASRPAGSGL